MMMPESDQSSHEMSVEQQVDDVSARRPHVLLLGAGASRAALPNGDRSGRTVPLLKEVAQELSLERFFPGPLRELAVNDFEAAYSRLSDAGETDLLRKVDEAVRGFFATLELPDEPNLYDIINLSMRRKDVIATFNWDPFLVQSQIRLARLGLAEYLPNLLFLHGNVAIGYCMDDKVMGRSGQDCFTCGNPLAESRLLFPVEHKDYNSDPAISQAWKATQAHLKSAAVFTVFGYSAPVTDKEAVDLLREGWGSPSTRELEQTEVISRPGADEDELRRTWDPFIHTHHYSVLGSFYDSSLGRHPRRSIEAWWNQYLEVKWLESHDVPQDLKTMEELVDWFRPLLDAEDQASEFTGDEENG